MNGRQRKRGIAVNGLWLPMLIEFLRSRACAELSPHGIKLLVDVLSMLGPNATRNGDLCLTPKLMAVRGWSSKSTLSAAISELQEHGLIAQTRQGSRLDCSLWACTLYPLDCDMRKLDVGPGSYRTTDWMHGGALASPPTEGSKAVWRHARKGASTGARKSAKTQTVTPPRDDLPPKRPAPGRTDSENEPDFARSSRPGTKSPVFDVPVAPPRGTYLNTPSLQRSQAVQEVA